MIEEIVGEANTLDDSSLCDFVTKSFLQFSDDGLITTEPGKNFQLWLILTYA